MKTTLLITTLILLDSFAGFAQCGSNMGSCSPGTGSIISYNNSYNCHQYVRAALEKTGWVDLDDGEPVSNEGSFSSLDNSNIKNDRKFIKVSKSYANAIVSNNSDHSTLILNGGMITDTYGYLASTPGVGAYLYKHGHAAFSTSSCNFSFYAYMGDLSASWNTSTLVSGNTRTFSITKPVYVSSVAWDVDTRYLEIVSQNSTSVTVRAECDAGYSGIKSAYVKATLTTSCGSRTVTKSFNVDCGTSDICNGTLNGNYLYAWNSVPANYTNTVVMNGSGPYSWVKTSGTTSSWYTASNGKYLYFSIPSGYSASFNVTASGCNRNVSFSASSFYSSSNRVSSLEPKTGDSEIMDEKSPVLLKVFNIMNGAVIKEGVFEQYDENQVLDDLKPGMYLIDINGARKKVLKR